MEREMMIKRDLYFHQYRVGIMTERFCNLFMVKKKKNMIHAALNHDIGKLYIKVDVFQSKTLTEEEFEEAKKHSIYAMRSKRIKVLDFSTKRIIKEHHENFDGTGYPKGKRGKKISVGARILRILDTIDAMMSERSYKASKQPFEVMEELTKGSGTLYDPDIIEIVMKNFNVITEGIYYEKCYDNVFSDVNDL